MPWGHAWLVGHAWHAWLGGICGEGVCVWESGGVCGKGACMAKGDMHGEGGACVVKGAAFVLGGMCERKGSHCSGWYPSYWNAFLF